MEPLLNAELFTHVGEESHESGAFDGGRDRVLARSGTTALATANDPALSIDHLLEQFHVLVIDIHGTRTMAIDEDRVFFAGA